MLKEIKTYRTEYPTYENLKEAHKLACDFNCIIDLSFQPNPYNPIHHVYIESNSDIESISKKYANMVWGL